MNVALWKCFPQAGNVICTAWYPLAVPDDPSTFCFLASVKDCPIKLLDGTDGRVSLVMNSIYVLVLIQYSFVLLTDSLTTGNDTSHRIVYRSIVL